MAISNRAKALLADFAVLIAAKEINPNGGFAKETQEVLRRLSSGNTPMDAQWSVPARLAKSQRELEFLMAAQLTAKHSL